MAAAFVSLLLVSVIAAQEPAPGRLPDAGVSPGGASTVVLDSTIIQSSGARTLAELLAGRVAGLSVTFASGISGTSPRIHVRGSTGMTGTAEPLLYIDNVLVSEDRYWLGSPVAGQAPAFAWDLPLDDIERVQVTLGPAGGAMLELGASRGAVFVATRQPSERGRRVAAFIDAVPVSGPVSFPPNYGTISAEFPENPGACTLSHQAFGECEALQATSWNPLRSASPFQSGVGSRLGIRTFGGLGAKSVYRVGGTFQRGAELVDGGSLDRFDVSGAFTGNLREDLALTTNARYSRANGDYPAWSDYLAAGLLGESQDDPVTRGYFVPLSVLAESSTSHKAEQLTVGASGAWSATDKLLASLRIGLDRRNRRDSTRLSYAPPHVQDVRGSSSSNALNAAGRLLLSHRLPASAGGTAQVGVSVVRVWPVEQQHALLRWSNPDAPDLGDTEITSTTRLWSSLSHVALHVHERIQLGPNRTLGLGARYDVPSFEGTRFKAWLSPIADFSWDVLRERSFPRTALLSELRLRGAYGESGDPQTALLRRVERTRELELGVAATTLSGFLAVDAAVYRRTTTDAVLLRTGPSGTFPGPQIPLGGARLTNSGIDAQVTIRPLDLGPLRWRIAATGSLMRHGNPTFDHSPFVYYPDPAGLNGWYFSSDERFGSVFGHRLTYADANGDGVIDTSEVTVGNPFSILGLTQPKRIFGINTSVTFRERLTVGALLDGQGGHVKFNDGELRRCIRGICRGLHDRSAPLDEQGRAVAARYSLSYSGFVEDASFVKLRELWMRYELPRAVLPPGARQAAVAVAARNLVTWTGYSGLDPEAGSFIAPGLNAGDNFGQPLLRSLSARLEIGW